MNRAKSAGVKKRDIPVYERDRIKETQTKKLGSIMVKSAEDWNQVSTFVCNMEMKCYIHNSATLIYHQMIPFVTAFIE